MDDEYPVQLASGDLACPQCRLALVKGAVPYYLGETLLGRFDGLKCETCSYGLLSKKGYDDSGKLAARMNRLSKPADGRTELPPP